MVSRVEQKNSRRKFVRRALGLTAAGGVGVTAALVVQPGADAADTFSSPYTVNVKDFGAKGDGSTDDSKAIRTAITEALSGRKSGVVQKEVYFPPGNYKVTQKDTFMWSPTNGQADQIFGLRFRGGGPRVTNIDFVTSFGATSDPRENNLITAAVRLRYTYFEDMSFRSTNPNNRFAYFWSRDDDDTNLLYPAYGHGQNQYFVYRNVEWRGQWDRVIGIDGDQQANNNSEHHFLFCSTDTVSKYTDAFLHCGITNPSANPQQNQFLNFFMESCNFALAGGNFFRFDRGGSINVIGGSWSMVGTEPACYFYMPSPNGELSATRLHVSGVRFEPKMGTRQRIIDCAWGQGNVTFTSCSDMAAVQVPSAAAHNYHRYVAANGRIPIVRYQDCVLAGHHMVDSGTTRLASGKVIYEGCRFYHTTTAVGGASSTAFLRSSAAPARYAFRDSWATPDVSG